MKNRYYFLIVVSWLFTLSLVQPQTQKKWISAYYGLWSVPRMYLEKVDFSKVTHIIHFSANPVKISPYLDVLVSKQDSFNIQYGGTYNGNDMKNPWYSSDIQKDIITRAHKAKAKVVLSDGGIYGGERKTWAGLREIRRGWRRLFLLRVRMRNGGDMMELNWEFPTKKQRDDFSLLIMRFRRELDQWKPRGEFIATTL